MPEVVEANVVLVKTSAFSCNYRDKGHLFHFYEICKESTSKMSNFYSFFGSDFVGEVIKVGENVRKFTIGDRVMPDNSYPKKIDGSYGGVVTNLASKRIQKFPESCLIKVPDSMSDIEAAAFPLTAITAHSMVSKSNLEHGDKVLISSPFSNTSLACLELLKNESDIELYVLTTHAKEAILLSELFDIKQIFVPEDFYSKKNKVDVVFDVIIDPFFNLHMDYLHPYLNYSSRYISCGATSSMLKKSGFYNS